MSNRTHLKELYKEIEAKRKDLFDVDRSYLMRHKSARAALVGDAKLSRKEDLQDLAHSVRIEHPYAHIHALRLPRKEEKKLRGEVKDLVVRLKDTWINARLAFPNDGEVNAEYINTIARMIEPQKNMHGFRREDVLIGSMYPPTPAELQREMGLFLYKNRELHSPLEKAFHAHFHIARIHPYRDGNGRTSRMIQNTILDRFGYPVVIIKEGERHIYYDLLDGARREFNSNGNVAGSEEEKFYEFLGTKVNMTFDKMLHNS